MPQIGYKSISISDSTHEKLASAAAKYSEQIGVPVSINKFIAKLLADWEKGNEAENS